MSSCCHDGFTLNIPGGTAQKFKDYMHFSSLDNANRDLVKMLFSEKNLEADMSVGFKGNPNIGSVVLNQFIGSDDFAAFANSLLKVMLYSLSVRYLAAQVRAVFLFCLRTCAPMTRPTCQTPIL